MRDVTGRPCLAHSTNSTHSPPCLTWIYLFSAYLRTSSNSSNEALVVVKELFIIFPYVLIELSNFSLVSLLAWKGWTQCLRRVGSLSNPSASRAQTTLNLDNMLIPQWVLRVNWAAQPCSDSTDEAASPLGPNSAATLHSGAAQCGPKVAVKYI